MYGLTFGLIGVQSEHSRWPEFTADVHLLMLIYNEILCILSLEMAFHMDRWYTGLLKRCQVVTASLRFIVRPAASDTYGFCCNYRTVPFVIWKQLHTHTHTCNVRLCANNTIYRPLTFGFQIIFRSYKILFCFWVWNHYNFFFQNKVFQNEKIHLVFANRPGNYRQQAMLGFWVGVCWSQLER